MRDRSVSRRILTVDPVPEEDLKAAVEEFLACALKGLEGQVPSQRQLAALIENHVLHLVDALLATRRNGSSRSQTIG